MDETTSVATKPPIASDDACANCGHTPVGRYCPACGQRQLSRAQFSLRHLAGELSANLLQWDNKLLRTLVLALAKPGHLSAQYIAGARSRYSSPITLLLLLFFFFFIGSVPLTDFTLPLQAHLEWGKWYSAPFADWLHAKAAATSGGMSALALAFGQQQHELAKTLVLLHVPLFAIGLKVLHVRRDVYSPAEVPEPVKRQVLLWGLNLPMAAVLLLTLKRAYRQSWWLALLKLPLAILVFAAAHMLYRALTFGATLMLL